MWYTFSLDYLPADKQYTRLYIQNPLLCWCCFLCHRLSPAFSPSWRAAAAAAATAASPAGWTMQQCSLTILVPWGHCVWPDTPCTAEHTHTHTQTRYMTQVMTTAGADFARGESVVGLPLPWGKGETWAQVGTEESLRQVITIWLSGRQYWLDYSHHLPVRRRMSIIGC